jgi:hypothetical protein
MKHSWNYSISKMAATHTFWLYCQNTGRSFLGFGFESTWVLSVHCAWFYHMAFTLSCRSQSQPLSFQVSCLGASIALLWMEGLLGNFFQKSLVSSQLKIYLDGIILLSWLLWACCICGSSFSSTGAGILVYFIFFSPNIFLSLCDHPLLTANGLMSSLEGSLAELFIEDQCPTHSH